MDLIWGHISPEPVSCPKLKNIGLTFWHFQKTSFWFSRHVLFSGPSVYKNPERPTLSEHQMVSLTPILTSRHGLGARGPGTRVL